MMINTYETPTEYPQYPLEVTNDFINDPPHENESAPFLAHPPQTRYIISQQSNNVTMYQNFQMFFNYIKTFEENINRQLEQVNELKNQLNQMKQSFITQQVSVPRRISRNYVIRPHPYLNERPPSRTPTIRSAVPTYLTTEQLASSNNLYNNIPAETAVNNEITSSGTQNYGIW
jgi:hypothetical protein